MPPWVTELIAARHAGRPLVLLFDFDGTLTPIVRHPGLAVLSERTRSVLDGLSRWPGVTVGVFSGRALGELKELIGLPLPYYAGSGGLEMELVGERRSFPTPSGYPEALTALAESLGRRLAEFPGTWVERKPSALTIHYRELPSADAGRFIAAAGVVLGGCPQVRFRVVSRGIEVTPAGGWHKGTAAEAVLTRQRAAFPGYFGDAANDEEGMAVVAAAGGVTVGVGPEPPAAAAHHVPDPDRLRDWLEVVGQRMCAGSIAPDDER